MRKLRRFISFDVLTYFQAATAHCEPHNIVKLYIISLWTKEQAEPQSLAASNKQKISHDQNLGLSTVSTYLLVEVEENGTRRVLLNSPKPSIHQKTGPFIN